MQRANICAPVSKTIVCDVIKTGLLPEIVNIVHTLLMHKYNGLSEAKKYTPVTMLQLCGFTKRFRTLQTLFPPLPEQWKKTYQGYLSAKCVCLPACLPVYIRVYVYIQETTLGIFLSLKTVLKLQKGNIHHMAIWY